MRFQVQKRNKTGADGEIALPASFPSLLHEAVSEVAGPEAARAVLGRVGQATGEELARSLERALPEGNPGPVEAERFWRLLSDLLARRGWGRLVHHPLHPGVGSLTALDWAPAAEGEEGGEAAPLFDALLTALLSRLAGGEVEVMEIPAPSESPGARRWLFGGKEAMGALAAAGPPPDSGNLDALLARL